MIIIWLQRVMGALTSIPLCQRARGAEEGGDTNNNLQGEEDRNITQVIMVIMMEVEVIIVVMIMMLKRGKITQMTPVIMLHSNLQGG